MGAMRGAVLAALYVCLAVCSGGREDRLTNKDDLEQMLKALEKDTEPNNPERTEIADSLAHDPALTQKPAASQRRQPTHDTSGGNSDLLDELTEIIEQLRKQRKDRDHGQAGVSSTEDVSPLPVAAPTTSAHSPDTTAERRHQEVDSTNTLPDKDDIVMQKIRKLLKQYYHHGSDDQTTHTTQPMTTTTPKSTTTTAVQEDSISMSPAVREELKRDALEVAAKASLIYLRLKQL